MKKRIVAIVAIVALIAIVAVCLTACNADSIAKKLENKGYEAVAMDAEEAAEEYAFLSSLAEEIKWAAAGIKGATTAGAVKFGDKETAEEAAKLASLFFETDTMGSILYFGSTEEALKDVK